MHVALYFHDRLPVKGYGGTQRVVVWLARGLAQLGHRVSLIAGAGSKVPEATLIPLDLKRVRGTGFDITPLLPPGLDIVHSFSPSMRRPAAPFVATQEGNSRPGLTAPADVIFVSANHAERNGRTAFVYNGIDPAEFRYQAVKEDYDFFLGRLHKEKGYAMAIEGALRTGRKLVIAGGWRPSFRRLVRFLGEVDGEEKAKWLSGARCLWMPAQWDEPFGLTLAEALMSGTPIIGTHRGSLPEIVSDDVGGLGDSLDELVAIAERINLIDPAACRARAERHFSHQVMAEEYLRFYQHFLAHGELPAGRPATA
ncbi:MAG TPA: glycosyltransferase [Gemmatimonadales bacterium]|jgi:glycosyltransferase involved in cell wall biosynthesis|nr:glycosyltransferase [Gemmatimonadales bacterium]